MPVMMLFVPAGALVDRSDRRTLSAARRGRTGVDRARARARVVPRCAGRGVPRACLSRRAASPRSTRPRASSLIPLVIPREELVRANRISSSLQETAQIGGPALAGLALMFFAALGGLRVRRVHRHRGGHAVSLAADAARDRVEARRPRTRATRLARRPALHLPLAAAPARAHARHVRGAVRRRDRAPAGRSRRTSCTSARSASACCARRSRSARSRWRCFGGRLPAWKRPGRVLLIVVALFGAVDGRVRAVDARSRCRSCCSS